VDQRGDLALAQAERLRGGRLEDALDAPELDEVVARAHRADLGRAAGERALGDLGGLGALEPALGLGVGDVVVGADAVALDEHARAVAQHRVERAAAQRERAVAPGARGRAPRDLLHEPLLALPELTGEHRQGEQANAAVDVVADAAGGDDAVGQLDRRDGADREAVAGMDVGHRQSGIDDPRQRRDVLQLHEAAVLADRLDQLRVGVDAGGHPQVGALARLDLPEQLVDGVNAHQTSRTTRARQRSPSGSKASRCSVTALIRCGGEPMCPTIRALTPAGATRSSSARSGTKPSVSARNASSSSQPASRRAWSPPSMATSRASDAAPGSPSSLPSSSATACTASSKTSDADRAVTHSSSSPVCSPQP
jgi:hypothetical protein